MENFGNLTEKQKERFYEFVKESILLTQEENAAIDRQIPMTQELFEACIEHCIRIDDMNRVYTLIDEYPQFIDGYMKKAEQEISKTELPEETSCQREAGWDRFYQKIIEMYETGE